MTHKALIRQLQISCLGLDPIDPLRLLVDDVIEALAQTQEPVATDWNAVHEKLELVWYRELSADEGLDEIQDLINTTPPQRTWVGLTADEIWDEWLEQSKPERNTHNFVVAFTRAIEAKLKAKNT